MSSMDSDGARGADSVDPASSARHMAEAARQTVGDDAAEAARQVQDSARGASTGAKAPPARPSVISPGPFQ